MSLKHIFIVFSCSSLLSVVAQAQSSGSLTANEQQFLQMAAQTDMTQAHLGQMAQQQSDRQDVKNFGQTLDQSHTKDCETLTAIASRNGATIPKGIDAQHQSVVDGYKNLTGKKFDKQFLHQEKQMHRSVIDQYKHEAAQGENPALREYANNTLPTLEDHLNKVQELSSGKPMSKTKRPEQAPASGYGSK
jgi:putative membrane protein